MICAREQSDRVFTVLCHTNNRMSCTRSINNKPRINPIFRQSITRPCAFGPNGTNMHNTRGTTGGSNGHIRALPPKTHRHISRCNGFPRRRNLPHLIEIIDIDRTKIINRHRPILADFTRCQNCHVQNICCCGNRRANLDGFINAR